MLKTVSSKQIKKKTCSKPSKQRSRLSTITKPTTGTLPRHYTTTSTSTSFVPTTTAYNQRKNNKYKNNHMSNKNYNNKNNNNNNNDKQQKGMVFTDTTLFGVEHGIATGKSYSNSNRPKWVLNLEESLTNTPDIRDPNLRFPIIDTTSTTQQIHSTFKIPMSYSNDIDGEYNNNAIIKFKETKSPKPNVALLVSYRGTGYQGLQLQFEGENQVATKTVEGDMLNAILKAGYITELQAKAPHKSKWSRAARTDKGVHAATNLINVKLRVPYAEQSPEVMYVSKKAKKFASHCYSVVVPPMIKALEGMINECTIDTVEEDIIDNTMDDNNNNNDDVVRPILLTKQRNGIIPFLKDHVAVDLLGRITVSPHLIHTLQKFKILSLENNNGIDTIVKRTIDQLGDKVPKHEFTQWEQKLLHLVAQFGSEWDQIDLGGDDDDDGEKKEEKKDHIMSAEEEKEALMAKGLSEIEIKNLSKRQRFVLLCGGKETQPESNRHKNQDKIPYIRQMGWLDEDVAHLTNPDFFSDCIQSRLRQFFPSQFHLARAVKVAGSFDAKMQASSRTYEYIVPSFAFMPIKQYPEGLYDKMLKIARRDAFENIISKDLTSAQSIGIDASENNNTRNKNNKRNRVGDVDGDDNEEVIDNDGDDGNNSATNVTSDIKNNDNNNTPQHTTKDPFSIDELVPPQELKDYRLSPQDLIDIQFTLSHFLGTRSHHNFTSGKKASDPSSKRFIRSFKPIGTFTIQDNSNNSIEFVHLCVMGDSFLLHQIRKMVGFSMSMIRGNYNDITLDALKIAHIDDRYQEPYQAALCAANATSAAGGNGDNNNNNIIDPTTPPSPSPHLIDICAHAFGHVFSNKRYNIPPAPALGLLLDHVHYDSHDFRTLRSIPASVKNKNYSHIRETLHASYQRSVPFITQIKSKEIYREIAIQELTISNAWRWLHLLNVLNWDIARLDDNGVPFKMHRVNHEITKQQRIGPGGVIDVHNNDGNNKNDGGVNNNAIEYVVLDDTNTAAVPTFNNNTEKQ